MKHDGHRLPSLISHVSCLESI